MEFFQQGLALALVFGLLATALWLVKRRQLPAPGSRGALRMQVVERVALTPQHTICLVKVGERLIIIGTAPSSCQLIDAIEERVCEERA
jgi:flagellar biosynthetic protein FliO